MYSGCPERTHCRMQDTAENIRKRHWKLSAGLRLMLHVLPKELVLFTITTKQLAQIAKETNLLTEAL